MIIVFALSGNVMPGVTGHFSRPPDIFAVHNALLRNILNDLNLFREEIVPSWC